MPDSVVEVRSSAVGRRFGIADAGGLLACWTILSVWSLLRTLIPAVNEPHYLCKARHLWDPTWCAGDLFLESSNPHLIFYLTFGWLMELLPPDKVAFIARLVCLLVVAVGWRSLTLLWLPRWPLQALALSLFLLFQALINFSGEWLVGGAESKVLAYGFGFWAVGRWQQRSPLSTAMLLGLAVTYHPLVGGWLSLCLLLAHWGEIGRNWLQRNHVAATDPLPRALPNWKSAALTGFIWLLFSLPGLIPAVVMLAEPASDRTRFAGDYLQVYYRLKHHLDPMWFKWWRYAGYALMSGAILLIGWRLQKLWRRQGGAARPELGLLLGLFAASLLVAGAGVLLGLRWGPPADMPLFELRLKLLKFYPFRLFDLWTPALLSILIVTWLTTLWPPTCTHLWRVHCSWVLVLVIGLRIPFSDWDSARMTWGRKLAWLDVCSWIEEHTPRSAAFVTPNDSWAFKWFAERSEYVSFKDCPQDAPGIVEWNRRLLAVSDWNRTSYADARYDQQDLEALASLTGATHLLTWKQGPFAVEPVYRNDYYRVYELPAATQE